MGRRQRAKQRGAKDGDGGAPPVKPNRRSTAPVAQTFRIRPPYHKVIGVLELVVGIAIVIVNYIDYADVSILPGGHQEVYLILGVAIAAGSMWWFGAFDREPTPDDIRRLYERKDR
ncbi:MAG: hypothetical protein ABIV94_10725 [Acidimicrobiales bacterium]